MAMLDAERRKHKENKVGKGNATRTPKSKKQRSAIATESKRIKNSSKTAVVTTVRDKSRTNKSRTTNGKQ